MADRDEMRGSDRDNLDEKTQRRLEEMERRQESGELPGQTRENRHVSGSSTYETLPDQGGRELGSGE